MADAKISELAAGTAPDGSELVEIVQGGVNVKVTTQDIADLGGGGGHVIEEEGTPLTQRTKLNFVGAGVTVTDDSGDDASVVTIPSQVTQVITNGVTATAPSEDAVFDALALKANLASPTLTGVPVAPTAAPGTNTTQLATTAFVLANSSIAFVSTGTVWVDAGGNDSTGVLGRQDLPFLTITAALAAGSAVTNLRIRIGIGTFVSPSSANLRSNLWLEGAGKPGYNNTVTETAFAALTITDPTALSGGTILQGTLLFQDKKNVTITDLGVDCGSAYVTGGGTEGNQIAFLSATIVYPFALMTNVVIKNVTTLGRTAGSAFHSIQLENCFKPIVMNCDTYFSTHGFTMKNYGGQLIGIRGNFHTTNAIVIKTDTYAVGWNTIVNGFEIQGGGGITIDLGSGTTTGNVACKIANGIMRSPTFGIKAISQTSTFLHYMEFDNVRVYGSAGIGFEVEETQSLQIRGCMAIACTTGFLVTTASTNTFNAIYNSHAEACTTGFNISAASSTFIIRNCSSRNNTNGFTLGGSSAVIYTSGLTFESTTNPFTGAAVPISIERQRVMFGGTTTTAPTAQVHIAAGTTAASTAPLKFTSGTNMTTPEAGAVEFDGTNYFVTSSSTRYTLAKTLTATAALNFDLTSVNIHDLTITVTGAADGDSVALGVPNASIHANVIYTAWVSAVNTVTVRASRVDVASGADPASGTFRAAVLKY